MRFIRHLCVSLAVVGIGIDVGTIAAWGQRPAGRPPSPQSGQRPASVPARASAPALDPTRFVPVVVIRDGELDEPMTSIRNSQFLPDGSLDSTRAQPRNAGFGAVTGANPMRSIQATLRFSF